MTVVNVMPQKILFLAGVNLILNFELVQNFIFYVQVLVTANDWAKVLCSHQGVQGQEGCRGLKHGSQDRDWDKKQCGFAFFGVYGIFTSVNDEYIADISRIYDEFTVVNCCKRYI